MHPHRKHRLIVLLVILSGLSVAAAFALYALRENINLYYTPTQIIQGHVPKGVIFRVGGIVKKNSVHHAKENLQVNFVITDMSQDKLKVIYNGVLPDLFKEGQGIVVQGKLNNQGAFIADQVLAKHGAEYKPFNKKKRYDT